ncbi:MAG: hypothetical protein CM1200mP33_3650 [Chloroflexota bacterium]|nr:MAG: hypothetical protein CM1200mP33_3650 [Chloroflexota bacterium]
MPAWVAGWALALIGLFNILGTLMYGYLGDSYSKKNLLTGLYSLRSVLFLVFFLSPKTEFTVLIFAKSSWDIMVIYSSINQRNYH